VTALSRFGLTVDLPRGWEGSVFRRTPGPGEETHPVLHAGSFPLPPERGDYGNGAVEVMKGRDVFIALLEDHPSSAGAALYAARALPRSLKAGSFNPCHPPAGHPGPRRDSGVLQRVRATVLPVCGPGIVGAGAPRRPQGERRPRHASRGAGVSPAPVWAGPYLAAALLLVAAGLAKVRRPADTAIALRRAGLPVPDWVVRAGAGAEVAAGCWAFTSGRLAAGVVALSYLGFAGFVALALRRGSPVSSCGCFGGRNKTDNADSPPTLSHAVLNLAAAATAGWAALHARPGVVSVLGRQPLAGVPLVLLTGAGAYLAYLVMGALPKALAAGGAR